MKKLLLKLKIRLYMFFVKMSKRFEKSIETSSSIRLASSVDWKIQVTHGQEELFDLFKIKNGNYISHSSTYKYCYEFYIGKNRFCYLTDSNK